MTMDTKNPHPFFSVLVPVYNGEKCISRCIQSVLDQTFRDFELIICDDASTDNTLQLIGTFSKKDSRIRILHHKTNTRALIARNNLIRAAKGKYCVFSDADDELLPDFLEHGAKILSNKHYDIIHFSFYTEGVREITLKRMGFFSNSEFFGKDIVKNHLFSFPIIFAPFAKIYSKNILEKAIPPDMLLSFIDDIPLTLRASAFAESYYSTKKKGYTFHYGQGNFSKQYWTEKNIIDFCSSAKEILADFLTFSKKMGLDSKLYERLEELLTNNLFNQINQLPSLEKANAIRIYLQFFDGRKQLSDFILINKITPLSVLLQANLKFISFFLRRFFLRLIGKKKWIEP